jgi:predicted SnoaL-like aldol condensation-catalyzing enzyme
MADQESNKQAVVEFYELAFNKKEPEQAVEKYVGSQYIQHNPQAPDGPEAFIGFVRAFPEARVEIRRVIADDDIVVTHSLLKFTADDERGTVAADIFRLEDGRSSSTGTCCSPSRKRAPTRIRCSRARQLAATPTHARWPVGEPTPRNIREPSCTTGCCSSMTSQGSQRRDRGPAPAS